MAELLDKVQEEAIRTAGPLVVAEECWEHQHPDEEYAATLIASFESVRGLVAQGRPPKRPNRTRPLHSPEELQAELDAWDAASDEVWNAD
jgi:hypothetical protein